MSKSSKILIVGAGLGGLCAASALAQVGADVDVIDIKGLYAAKLGRRVLIRVVC